MGSSVTDLSQPSSSPNRSVALYESGSHIVGSSGAGGGIGGGGSSSTATTASVSLPMNNDEVPRLLTITTKKNTNLGISLMGGNAVGIYVHDVQKGSLADVAGMRMGDQIIEYNGADLRRVTAEHAANEISRPADTVTIIVQHNVKSK